MNEKLKKILQIFGLLIVVIFIGTVGYAHIEGWSYFDSFYMTFISITTVGFGETHDLTNMGRAFTILIIGFGYVIIALTIAQTGKFIIESEFNNLLSRKKTKKKVKKMKNHYIICGYGKIGKAISLELKNNKIPFVIIDQKEESIASAEDEGYIVIKGNTTQDQTLMDAGIDRATGLVACVSNDSDNLFIALAARELNPMLFIITRGEDASIEPRMLRAGADIVVSPVKLGGQQVANLLTKQIQNNSQANGVFGENTSLYGYSLTQLKVEDDKGYTVSELLQKNNALIAIAIKDKNNKVKNNPADSARLNKGDILIATTYDNSHENLETTIVKKEKSKRILIADDHRGLRMLFTKKLAAAGHKVVEVEDGAQAIEVAKESKFDLFILDVIMPFKTGYEVCADIRTRDKEVPIVLYSSDESLEFLEKGAAVGATECLRKTSKSNDLLIKVNQLIKDADDELKEEKNVLEDVPEIKEDVQFESQDKIKAELEEIENMVEQKNIEKDIKVIEKKDTVFEENNFDISSVLDLEQLKEITDGDTEIMEEAVNMFIEDTPAQLEKMNDAFFDEDFEEIRKIAHYLKGGGANIGFNVIEESARSLEQNAKDNDIETATDNFIKIRENFALIEENLKSFNWDKV